MRRSLLSRAVLSLATREELRQSMLFTEMRLSLVLSLSATARMLNCLAMEKMMLLLLILSTVITRAQEVALKTNLLGLATTSLNAGLEIGTGRKSTFQLFGALNPWKFSGDKKLRYWNVTPEYRWYTCQKFGGHFFGIHALGGEYNVKNVDLPFGILPKTEKGRHYEGWYVGGGLTYGYQWLLSEHLNLEGSIGLGYIYSPYKLYGRCDKCLNEDHRNYVGPTKAALSLIYAF